MATDPFRPAGPDLGPAILPLPARLDAAATADLRQALLVRRGQPLELQAGDVERVSTPAVQVLLAAARTWAADGQAFRLADAAPALQDAARCLGLSLDAFTAEGHPR